MKVDDPNAYRFIMQDEIYLLEKDKLNKPETKAKLPVEVPSTEIKTPDIEFNYLGKNNKNFLILVNYASEEFIPHVHLTALENILKRKELSLQDVAIFNINLYAPVTVEQLNKHFSPTKMLILGQSAIPINIQAPGLNEPVKAGDSTVLYSFSFEEMMNSNDNKKAFWEQMKNL